MTNHFLYQRRQFLLLLGGAAVAGPFGAQAEAPKMPVVGFLNPASAKGLAPHLAAFKLGLKDAGYVERRNVLVEYRWADGQYDRLPQLAADLVSRGVAVIAATGGSFSVRAAKEAATQSPVPIPILFVSGLDPVKEHVNSLERPETKVTGVAVQTTAQVLLWKRVELLRKLVPGATTIALLTNKNNTEKITTSSNGALNAAEAAAQEVQFAVTGTKATGPGAAIAECASFCPKSARTDSELADVFDSLSKRGNSALVVGADPFFTDRRAQIVALARQTRVPAIYPWREYVDAGGLISYGSSLASAYRQVGRYVGKILRGANAEELPVAQEGVFELAINLRTARALNLMVPQPLLASADSVIK